MLFEENKKVLKGNNKGSSLMVIPALFRKISGVEKGDEVTVIFNDKLLVLIPKQNLKEYKETIINLLGGN